MSDKYAVYADWISSYARSVPSLLGRCHEACFKMQKAFPELRVVKGHVEVLSWGKRSHVWLETPDGCIVDPTMAQYPAIEAYEPWKPGDEVRVGRCMECGLEIWRRVTSLEGSDTVRFCDDQCHDSFISSLTR